MNRRRDGESITFILELSRTRMDRSDDPLSEEAKRYGMFSIEAFLMLRRPQTQFKMSEIREDLDQFTADRIIKALADRTFSPEKTLVAADGIKFRESFGFRRNIYSN